MLSYEIKAIEDLFEAQGEANNRQDRKKNHIQVELHTSDCHKLKLECKQNHLKLQGKKSKSLSYTYKIKISINERPLGMVGRRDMFHGWGELGLSPGGCHLVLLLLFKVVEVGGPVFLFTLSPSVMPCQSQTIFTQNSPLLQYVRYYLS